MNSVSDLYENFWVWTKQTRPPWRESFLEAFVLFCVFGITGSSSVKLVRPFLMQTLGIEGTMMGGPNSYRFLSIFLVTPIYCCILLTIGTLVGRHTYFLIMVKKILGRFLPSAMKMKLGLLETQIPIGDKLIEKEE